MTQRPERFPYVRNIHIRYNLKPHLGFTHLRNCDRAGVTKIQIRPNPNRIGLLWAIVSPVMFKFLCRFCLAVLMALAAFAVLVPLNSSRPALPQDAVAYPAKFNHPPPLAVPSPSAVRRALLNPGSIRALSPAYFTPDILWMARAMYSESKRPQEQELIAWVIRNRLESRHLGAESIREVVLFPYQFSAFNPGRPQADFYASLHVLSTEPGWQRTLALANFVTHADTTLRPFAPSVRHFHSPQAMRDGQTVPAWTTGHVPVQPDRAFELDAERFRFFADVD